MPAAKRLPTHFISHGGGPWPWMEGMVEGPYANLARSLRRMPADAGPDVRGMLMVSAHWEAPQFTAQAKPNPGMLYDYGGFPQHTYSVRYPAPGDPALAARAQELLCGAGIATAEDNERDYDHGMFSPMAVAWPDADLPVVQLSLKAGLDPAEHLAAGRALAPLRDEGILVVGSGLSYHNLRAFGPAARQVSNANKISELIGQRLDRGKIADTSTGSGDLGRVVETPAGSSVSDLFDMQVSRIEGKSSIVYKGNELFVTPSPQTMTLAQASDWYRNAVDHIPEMVDTKLPLEAQARMALQLREYMHTGAMRAVPDDEASIFANSYRLPTIDELIGLAKKEDSKLTGDSLFQRVVNFVISKIELRYMHEIGACFAAGTLVHTIDGPRPISELKVGDLVLSRPEMGGENAYKPVVRTMKHANKPVVLLEYEIERSSGVAPRIYHGIICTPDHPFWINDIGWTAADQIGIEKEKRGIRKAELNKADGSPAWVYDVFPAYETGTSKLYVPDFPTAVYEGGMLADIETGGIVAHTSFDFAWTKSDEIPIPALCDVYNIEVEDYHTYFVGPHAIWVHNANCRGLQLLYKEVGKDIPIPRSSTRLEGRGSAGIHLSGKVPKNVDIFAIRATQQPRDDGSLGAALRWENTVDGRLVERRPPVFSSGLIWSPCSL